MAGELVSRSGMVLFLPLNETFMYTDVSGFDHNVTNEGPYQPADGFNDEPGGAIAPKSRSTYIHISGNDKLNLLGSFTLFGRFRPISRKKMVLFGWKSGEDVGAYFNIQRGRIFLHAQLISGRKNTGTTSASIGVNKWNDFAFSYDQTTGTLIYSINNGVSEQIKDSFVNEQLDTRGDIYIAEDFLGRLSSICLLNVYVDLNLLVMGTETPCNGEYTL